jgi:hypothetical protein
MAELVLHEQPQKQRRGRPAFLRTVLPVVILPKNYVTVEDLVIAPISKFCSLPPLHYINQEGPEGIVGKSCWADSSKGTYRKVTRWPALRAVRD